MVRPEAIEQAVRDLSILRFFPLHGPRRAASVYSRSFLDRIVDEEYRLAWLVHTLTDYVGEWPGPAQLRALYATRYRPADGIEGTHCAIAGFTPMDSERASLEAHENVKRLELEEPRSGGGLRRLN